MVVIVLINSLCLQSRYSVKLLYFCSAKTCQCPKYRSLDLRHLGVLDCIHQCVLRSGSMSLKLPCCILLAKGCNEGGLALGSTCWLYNMAWRSIMWLRLHS